MDALRDQAERATQRFRDECHVPGVKSFEAVIDEADKASSLVRHAHCSDLVVLTQARPEAIDHRLAQEPVEQVVLESAGPTLVIPHAGRGATRGMLAWLTVQDPTGGGRTAAPACSFADSQRLAANMGMRGRPQVAVPRRRVRAQTTVYVSGATTR